MTVHVDAGAAADSALRETQWLDGLAQIEGLPTGIVAFAALNDPDVDALLADPASALSRLVGVNSSRHICYNDCFNLTEAESDIDYDYPFFFPGSIPTGTSIMAAAAKVSAIRGAT